MSMPRPPTAHRHPHSDARQFDLFCDPPYAAAQTPQWQALPAETRHTLTKLMVRLKDMLDLAKHIVNQKTADFEPERFEDHYEEALTELINAKRQGKTIGPKPRPRGENVVDLMNALKKSLANEITPKGKGPRKASASQKEMLLPIEGKRGAEKKKAAKPEAVNEAQGRISRRN
jgi:hypothetical protein